jgi:hypothetical protein
MYTFLNFIMRFLFTLFCLPILLFSQYAIVGDIGGQAINYPVADYEAMPPETKRAMENGLKAYTDYLTEYKKQYYLGSISSAQPEYDFELKGLKGQSFSCSFSAIPFDEVKFPIEIISRPLDFQQNVVPTTAMFYCMFIRYFVENGTQGMSYYGSYFYHPNNQEKNPAQFKASKLVIDSFENTVLTGNLKGTFYRMDIVEGTFFSSSEAPLEVDVDFKAPFLALDIPWKPRGVKAYTTAELNAQYISPEQMQTWKDEPLSQYERRLAGTWRLDKESCGVRTPNEFRPSRSYWRNETDVKMIWRMERGEEQIRIYVQTPEFYNFDTQKMEKWWSINEYIPTSRLDFTQKVIKCTPENRPWRGAIYPEAD